MQRTELIGNLVRDAVRVEGQNGREPFMSFSVCCNERRGDEETKTFWEVSAPLSGVLSFLTKGKGVFVAGFPSAKAFLTKEQEPAAQMRLSAHVIELL